MTTILEQLKPNVRVFDRMRGRERFVANVEAAGAIVFLSLRDPKTGDVDRLPFSVASLASRFDILTADGAAFSAEASLVRLVAEAHRLNHAYLFNPVFATETSLIDPLPHQLVAVYGLPADEAHPDGVLGLLSHPRLRFLLADDAGAGKTIMAGLYMREMRLRRLVQRILIIPPAGLVGNWERELRNLFRLRFRIVDSADVREDNNPFSDPRCDLAILSLDTARQERVRQALADAPPYDLVVCDEAHKLSARRRTDLSIDASKRYETVEEIADRSQHLLLLTATPHMGKDDPYFFLWRLLEPKLFSTPEALHHTPLAVRRRYLLRRMKEEMVNFAGDNLFPPRDSKTISYPLNAEERELYDVVTGYVEENYRKTTSGNRSSVGLALSVIQRRLASSTLSIWRSLMRREQKLSAALTRLNQGLLTEEQFEEEQKRLPQKDLREEKTGDEEVSEDGQEEAERFDATISGATSARNAMELAAELAQLQELVIIARETYDQQRESKFERLRELLQDYPGTKILIFTEFRDTLEFLVGRMENLGYTGRIATIHGGMDYQERERQAERFRGEDCPYLIATDAAGEGINLQFCWLLINYDIPWNPARLEQRMGRVHRYKQQHDVLLLSLVAEDTREGNVLKTLLDKLELIRKRLGNDKVFDVIGEQLGSVSLSDLMFRATVQGEETAAVAAVERALDPAMADQRLAEQQARVEVSEVRSLLEALRRGQETAEERRMMPAYVRGFFVQAAPLLGFHTQGDTDGIFRLQDAPETVRRAVESYPAEVHERLTFDRDLALPKTAMHPEAIYLHPGEAVFESIMTLFLGRFENDAERGGVFYDSTSTEPYCFVLAKVVVVRPLINQEGMPTDERETLSEAMTGVILTQDGLIRLVPAHLLLTLDIKSSETADSITLPEALVTQIADPVPIESFVVIEHGLPLMEKVQSDLQERLPSRETQLVQAYNLRNSEGLLQRRKLRDDVEKGVPAAKSKLEKLEGELAQLDDAREAAIAALHQEVNLVELGPVTVYARALVLPLPAEEAQRLRDVQAEQVALQIVRDYEKAHGSTLIEDVSNPSWATGYDLRSHRSDGTVRYIEVKGRAGLSQVSLTENEWRQAANHRDKYWLYTVYHCETNAPNLQRVLDPFGALLAKSNGVVITAGDVLSAAQIDD